MAIVEPFELWKKNSTTVTKPVQEPPTLNHLDGWAAADAGSLGVTSNDIKKSYTPDSDQITSAQRQLNALGFSAGAEDGLSGPNTQAAVRAFQRENGLAVTGKLDAATTSALAPETTFDPLMQNTSSTPPPPPPPAYGSNSWAASLTDADVQARIDTWSGSDNDPILDTLVRERNSRLPEPESGWESLDDYREAVDTFEAEGIEQQSWAAADSGSLDPIVSKEYTPPAHGSSRWAESLSDAEIQRQIAGWSGSDNDPILDRLVNERNSRLPEPEGGWESLDDYRDAVNVFSARAMDPEVWAAADSGSLDPMTTRPTHGSGAWAASLSDAEIQSAITNWSGSDNDPILDRLVNERNSRLPEPADGWNSFSDYQDAVNTFAANAIAPEVWGAADSGSLGDPVSTARGIRYSEEEFSGMLYEVSDLDNKISNWSGTDNDPIFDQYVRERNALLEDIAGTDEELGRILIDLINDGTPAQNAILEAAAVRYEDASMEELLQQLQWRTAPGANFDPFAYGLSAELAERAETFTGADAGTINIQVAAWAESLGVTYNEAAAMLNSQASMDDGTDPQLIAYMNGPVSSGDEAANRLIADQELFVEMETARQRNTGRYDGKMSMEDIDAILADPDYFSDEAVALAQFFKDNPEEWATFDTARSGSALTGLTEGELGTVDGDNTTSFADIQQRATNGQLFRTLSEAQELNVLIDDDGDGVYSEDEFKAALDRLDQVNPELRETLDTAINYALDQGMDGETDTRAWHTKLRDGAWEIASLGSPPLTMWRLATDPRGLAEDYKSFGIGAFDAVVGMGQMAYDVSAMSPGSGLYHFESWRVDGDMERHRGVQMRQALPHMADAVMSLDPTKPQFWQAVEETRRSGTIDSHAGINLVKTTADWETFVDDPSRWAGQFAPDVIIGILTGGTGATITRTGSMASKMTTAGRRIMTEMMENGAEQTMRNAMRRGADLDIPTNRLGDPIRLDADIPAPRRQDNVSLDSEIPPPSSGAFRSDAPAPDNIPDRVSVDDELVPVGAANQTDNAAAAAGDTPRATGADDATVSTGSNGTGASTADGGNTSRGANGTGNDGPANIDGGDQPLPALTAGPANSTYDFVNVSSINDLRRRIPDHAERMPWKVVEDGAQQGIKWQWTDGDGNRWRVRAHERDPSAPDWVDDNPAARPDARQIESPETASGPWNMTTERNGLVQTNASDNWVYRVEVKPQNGPWRYVDGDGNAHKANVLNENSPHYNPNIANDTHIPFSDPLPALNAGPKTTMTLDELRDMPYSTGAERTARNKAAEQYIRELYGTDQGELRFVLDGGRGTALKTERKVDVPVFQEDGDALLLEVKNYAAGKVPLSSGIRAQVDADALVLRSADPQNRPMWIFTDNPPSDSLIAYLDARNVPWIQHN